MFEDARSAAIVRMMSLGVFFTCIANSYKQSVFRGAELFLHKEKREKRRVTEAHLFQSQSRLLGYTQCRLAESLAESV